MQKWIRNLDWQIIKLQFLIFISIGDYLAQ